MEALSRDTKDKETRGKIVANSQKVGNNLNVHRNLGLFRKRTSKQQFNKTKRLVCASPEAFQDRRPTEKVESQSRPDSGCHPVFVFSTFHLAEGTRPAEAFF